MQARASCNASQELCAKLGATSVGYYWLKGVVRAASPPAPCSGLGKENWGGNGLMRARGS